MTARRLGDREVSPLGVGTVSVSLTGGDRQAGVRTLCGAFDAGITWVDSAAAYVPSGSVADAGHNERMVATALREWGGDPGAITVVTKGGHKRLGGGFGADAFEVCGRRGYIREQCAASRRALGRDVIDVYLLHWPDPATPIEESMTALVGLQAEGLVKHVGLSNVTVEQLEAASRIGRVAAVQNHLAPGRTAALPVVRWCDSHGVAFMAYSPLGGSGRAKVLGQEHPEYAAVASAHGVSPQRVALAWVLSQAPVMLAVVGATRPESIIDSARAAELHLSDEELARLG